MTTEWFRQADEKAFGAADVAEAIRVLVLNYVMRSKRLKIPLGMELR